MRILVTIVDGHIQAAQSIETAVSNAMNTMHQQIHDAVSTVHATEYGGQKKVGTSVQVASVELHK